MVKRGICSGKVWPLASVANEIIVVSDHVTASLVSNYSINTKRNNWYPIVKQGKHRTMIKTFHLQFSEELFL